MKRLYLFSLLLLAALAACADEELPQTPKAPACDGCGDLFVACFQSGEVFPFAKEDITAAGPAADGITGPQSLALLGDKHMVVVGTLDGSFTVINRETMEIEGKLILEDSRNLDSVLIQGEIAYVIASGTNEVITLDLADPSDPKVLSSVSTGQDTNPMSAAFDAEGTLWVSLYMVDQIVPITDGDLGEAVEIPAVEGRPLPTGVAFAGGKIFVSLNNLDEAWAPAGNGRLVAFTPSNPEPELIDLGADCKNPGHLATDGERVYVPCGGTFMEEDGAVAAYDVASGSIETVATGGSPARLSLDPGQPGLVFAADSGSVSLLRIDFEASEEQVERHEICSEVEWEFVADLIVAP